tara:strand:+ start:262 stop:1203 length:942 start_codon:yes stop_codon:yes gene_type:complete
VIVSWLRSFWFRALLSTAVLAYLLSALNGHEAWSAVTAINPWYLLAAIAVDATTRATMISRWVVLIRSQGDAISTWSASRIFLISSFIGTALPTGGADIARAYALSQHTDNGRAAVASVAVDRLLGVTALMLLAIVGLAVTTDDAANPLRVVITIISILTVTSAVAAFFGNYLATQFLPAQIRQSTLGQWAIATAENIALYRTRYGVLAIVFIQSIVVQGLRIFEVFLLGSGLGLHVDLTYYLTFMPVGLLAFMLPVSIAGIGVPQGIVVWLLQPLGVSGAESFALSTLIVVLGVLCTLPGLFLYLRNRNRLG